MKITLKLFATLTDYLPEGAKGNLVDLEVDEGERVGAIIERFRLPEKLVHLVLINGTYVAPGDRPSQALKEGDQLAIWPPIAGG
jgi:molybdopterin converting factor small subunit